MIVKTHPLPVKRQAELLEISRANVYYLPTVTSEKDLAVMRAIDELHLEYPFLGARQGTSTVYHVGGGTLSTASPRKTYLNFRNGLSLIFKHISLSQLWWKLPFRIFLDWVAAAKFLIGGSGANCRAVLKAHVNFLASLKREVEKRNRLRSQFPNYRVKSEYKGLIAFDFYLRKRRSFSDLNM